MQGSFRTQPLIYCQRGSGITDIVIIDLLHMVEHDDGPVVNVSNIVLGYWTRKHVFEDDDCLISSLVRNTSQHFDGFTSNFYQFSFVRYG